MVNEIDVRYNEAIAKLLAKGCKFYTKFIGGHSGELAKTDLTDGKTFYRVWAEKDRESVEDSPIWADVDKFSVKILSKPLKEIVDNCYHNVDVRTLKEEESVVFYKIGYRSANSNMFGSREEAVHAQELHFSRVKARVGLKSIRTERFTSEKALKAVLPLVRRIKGLKTAKLSDVSYVCRDEHYGKICYYVCVKGTEHRVFLGGTYEK